MCGRIVQSGSRREYARAIGWDVSSEREWVGGDPIPSYNLAPRTIVRFMHQIDGRRSVDGTWWGYRTSKEAEERRKHWINARIEKALTGRYFRHMFRTGRVIVPSEGWYEWTVEGGSKQPWFIRLREDQPCFLAGLTNWLPGRLDRPLQTVETGVVIVTTDSEGGMVDIHDRAPVVLAPDEACRWIDPATTVEEAAHLAQCQARSVADFQWWRVSRRVNSPGRTNTDPSVLEPITA